MERLYDDLRDKITVIGLSGKAGSGKDYVAKTCFVQDRGFKNVSLAWHFKIECISRGHATYEEVFVTKPPRVRKLLQILGTEEGRDVWGNDIWIDTMFAWIKLAHDEWGFRKFVIPDVRYPNEMERIQNLGGKVYRVIGDRNSDLSEEAQLHVSETALSDDSEFDGVIYNPTQSPPDGVSDYNIYAQVNDILRSY